MTDNSETIEIIENRPDHHFRTELPNLIIDILTPNQLIVYIHLKRIAGDSGRCWMSMRHLCERCQLGETTVRKCIKDMSKLFLTTGSPLIEISQRKKKDGSRDSNSIRIVDIWRSNGDWYRKQNNPSLRPEKVVKGVPRQTRGGTSPNEEKEDPCKEDPMPTLGVPKGNACKPKISLKQKALKRALPFDKYQKKTGIEQAPSKSRKYQRSPEKEATFQWLLTLEIKDEKGVVDHDTMSVLAHMYTRKQLEDAYCHLQHKQQLKGLKVKKSEIALFRHILKNEGCPRGSTSDANLVYAKEFAKTVKWASMRIHEKYIDDPNMEGKDINLNLEHEQFKERLHNLFNGVCDAGY